MAPGGLPTAGERLGWRNDSELVRQCVVGPASLLGCPGKSPFVGDRRPGGCRPSHLAATGAAGRRLWAMLAQTDAARARRAGPAARAASCVPARRASPLRQSPSCPLPQPVPPSMASAPPPRGGGQAHGPGRRRPGPPFRVPSESARLATPRCPGAASCCGAARAGVRTPRRGRAPVVTGARILRISGDTADACIARCGYLAIQAARTGLQTSPGDICRYPPRP